MGGEAPEPESCAVKGKCGRPPAGGSLVFQSLVFSSAPTIFPWAFSCREPMNYCCIRPCTGAWGGGWVGGKSGWEHLVRYPMEKLPISATWATHPAPPAHSAPSPALGCGVD